MVMQTLSEEEIYQVAGGFGPPGALFGAGVGLTAYGAEHLMNGEPMTWKGVAWAAGSGALIGVGGLALKAASGGGLAAEMAWEPGLRGLSFGLDQISSGYRW